MENKVTITRPFGPKIGVVKLPNKIVTKLIDITDRLIVDETREKHGCALVGQIKEEVKITTGFEDPIKIQKLQRKGLIPGSQKFIKKNK